MLELRNRGDHLGRAVDWAYETAVAGAVKSKKVAAFYFEKHAGKEG